MKLKDCIYLFVPLPVLLKIRELFIEKMKYALPSRRSYKWCNEKFKDEKNQPYKGAVCLRRKKIETFKY